MARATVFNRDPAAQARAFEAQGFEYLHVVDLDGAFAGKPVNAAAVEAHPRGGRHSGAARRRHSRPRDHRGLARQGRRAASSSAPRRCAIRIWCSEAAPAFPGRIAVGIDARDGKVAVEGWAETSELVGARARAALRGRRRRRHRLYRHRPRRHCSKGLNIEATLALADALDDPGDRLGRPRLAGRRRARCRRRRARRLAGAITGRALYDGRLDPAAALALMRGCGSPSRVSA